MHQLYKGCRCYHRGPSDHQKAVKISMPSPESGASAFWVAFKQVDCLLQVQWINDESQRILGFPLCSSIWSSIPPNMAVSETPNPPKETWTYMNQISPCYLSPSSLWQKTANMISKHHITPLQNHHKTSSTKKRHRTPVVPWFHPGSGFIPAAFGNSLDGSVGVLSSTGAVASEERAGFKMEL